jgi:DNA-binding SARP family transcriptional activator
VLVRLLGAFDLLRLGSPVALRGGGRTEALLCTLALRHNQRVPRDVLLAEVWPDADPCLSGPALNSLVHHLHKVLADVLEGAPPVLHVHGSYRLNVEAGVNVDVAWFDALADMGDRAARDDPPAAIGSYQKAISLYGGDLCAADGQHAVIERERLRARYLTLLARSASHYYTDQDINASLDLALQLLKHDPCREDAHRLVMRCRVQLGERAQAMRQYRICAQVLATEFDAPTEPATQALYEQIRLDPSSV